MQESDKLNKLKNSEISNNLYIYIYYQNKCVAELGWNDYNMLYNRVEHTERNQISAMMDWSDWDYGSREHSSFVTSADRDYGSWEHSSHVICDMVSYTNLTWYNPNYYDKEN